MTFENVEELIDNLASTVGAGVMDGRGHENLIKVVAITVEHKSKADLLQLFSHAIYHLAVLRSHNQN
jgi:hypothetical protein